MRVSNQQVFLEGVSGMLTLQSRAAELQQQIATGRRLLAPSDDPNAATRVMNLDGRIAGLAQFQRNANTAETRLQHQDTVLGSVGDTLQRVRELVIAGRNASLGQADRGFIAAELEQRLDELVALGNARNETGEYLFAGLAVTTPPFRRDASNAVSYAGDQGVRALEIGDARTITEGYSGHDVFMAIRTGNGVYQVDGAATNTGTGQILPGRLVDRGAFQPHQLRISFTSPTQFDVVDLTTSTTILAAQPYAANGSIAVNGLEVAIRGTPAAGDEFTVGPAANQSMFESLRQTITALREPMTGAAAEARFQQNMDNALGELDQAQEKVLAVRAGVGARLQAIGTQLAVNDDLALQLKDARSRLQDADLTELVSRLAQETTALQAAQAAYHRIQGLSLFDYF
ncbi:MAG: flagellar hook-associated protein FlgL [Gammaproteobacteria bacterium]|nr:flagellar hook-associated protein FlgL [Gammaproteobacteria bacterium]